jgi:SAM-dependent methyltransferase
MFGASKPRYEFCLDLPAAVPMYERFVVQGWIAAERPVGEVRFARGGRLEEMPRPDVVAVHGERYAHVRGFRGPAARTSLRDGAWLDFEFEIGGDRCQRSIELAPSKDDRPAATDPGMKRRRLDRIRPALRRDLPHAETELCFDFLTPELRERHEAIETENIPAGGYDDVAMGIVDEFRDGLVLDAGAGLRRTQYENVVNLEIVPYPSTDVLSVLEELPFTDASFDAVLSFAVLEHVSDPFRCAQEMYRVLKPGGKIYANVPFLQPYHGYPSHFYNMTAQGIANLFPAELEVVSSEVPHYGLPIFTLTWFLNSWVAGLPPSARQELLDMRVQDLLGDGHAYLERDFVKLLPRERNFELASSTAMLGRKRGAS